MRLTPLTIQVSVPLLISLSLVTIAEAAWSPQDSGTLANLYNIEFLDQDNGFAVGDAGTVLRTTNGGATWTDISISSTFPVRDLSFINPLEGWVCTGDPSGWPSPVVDSGEIWKTTDAGATWVQLSVGTQTSRLGIFFVSATEGWSSGTHHDHVWPHPTVYRSTDGGGSWSGNMSSWANGWSYGIHFIDATTGWTVGSDQSSNGYVLRTLNGETWTAQAPGAVSALYGVFFEDASNGVVVGDGGTIIATSNGGMVWSTQTSGTASDLRGVGLGSGSVGVACGADGTLLLTDDGGSTWAADASGTTNFLRGVHVIDSSTAWVVGDNGTILRQDAAASVETDLTALAEEGRVFPNPFSTSATLALPAAAQNASRVTFTLYNLQGREVRQETVEGSRRVLEIPRGDLPGGVYYYELGSDRSVYGTGKLVIETRGE